MPVPRLRSPRQLARVGLTSAAALALVSAASLTPALATTASQAPAPGGAAQGGAVIVVMKTQHPGLNLHTQAGTLKADAQSAQAPVVSSIKASHGTGISQVTYPSSVAATVSKAEVSTLRANPAVAEVIPDTNIRVGPQAPQNVPRAKNVAKAKTGDGKASGTCPFNPAGPGKPLQEGEADSDVHASNGNPHAPDEGNSIATGSGVVVANEGMDQLAGNPNFTRPDGSHVVIDAPDYTADDSNDEFYGDASSIAAQGTVDYRYSGALPNATRPIPSDCRFYIKGDAPGASLLDLSATPYDSSVQKLSQVVAGVDNAVAQGADVISESFGVPYVPGSPDSDYFYDVDDAAVAAGVTVVASSGDNGLSGTVNAPASDPNIIAAAAVDNFRLVAMDDGDSKYVSNNMAALSSGGTANTNKLVDLTAPGYFGTEAACADGSGGCPPNYPTESMRGTSESAPLISGGAADVIQAYRDSHGGASPTPAQVKDVLTSTASDTGAPADEQGSGLLNVYSAVKAAQQLPGSTTARGGDGSGALVSTPSQLDLQGAGRSVSNPSVSLFNSGSRAAKVTGSYRSFGPEFGVGKVTTEHVSAPASTQPVPEAGATAARPVSFTVPSHLGRLDLDLIWPDATNANRLYFQVFNPSGALVQESYDDGTLPTATSGGSIPNIQHVEVSDPTPGKWTARILWGGVDQDLALPPTAPGSYTGTVSFKASGQDVTTSPASRAVTIPAHQSKSVPLRVAFPASPGDSPESVQFTSAGSPAVTSVPIARRTVIPSSGGSFRTLITSTVGRDQGGENVGQGDAYKINVPSGASQLSATFRTADTSADNVISYYLVSPDGTVAATGSTPNSAGASPGTVTLTAPAPASGTWEIDVVLGLTVSGKEFTQPVYGTATVTGG